MTAPMRITWRPCPHITYISDDEDQSGWSWLSVECPDCGVIGVNVEDGVIQGQGEQ